MRGNGKLKAAFKKRTYTTKTHLKCAQDLFDEMVRGVGSEPRLLRHPSNDVRELRAGI